MKMSVILASGEVGTILKDNLDASIRGEKDSRVSPIQWVGSDRSRSNSKGATPLGEFGQEDWRGATT